MQEINEVYLQVINIQECRGGTGEICRGGLVSRFFRYVGSRVTPKYCFHCFFLICQHRAEGGKYVSVDGRLVEFRQVATGSFQPSSGTHGQAKSKV